MKFDLLQGFYLRDLLIDPVKGSVTGQTGSAHVHPKAMEVLLCLASESGRLVTRDSLLETVWGSKNASQEALSRAISELRHALADHHDDPSFIQTLPKRGYRLIIDPKSKYVHLDANLSGGQDSLSAPGNGFIGSLNKRGVLETAVAYLVLGWLLIQIADIVFAQLLLPKWMGTFVTVLVIAGFPISLILSWFLEFRDGRAIPHSTTTDNLQRRRFSRTYLSIIAALGIAAVAVFIYDQNVGLPEATPTTRSAAALPPITEGSIAVLPFFNVDGSEETQIFSNGLADDLITRLSRVPGLRVSSRGDAFTLDPNSSSARVRERLRVARYLEGSVQMADNQLRVIVQLIDSASGFHILSRSFDRSRQDFFVLRNDITELTVSNIRAALPQEPLALPDLPNVEPNLDAYLLYRRGVDASQQPASAEMIAATLGWYDAALDVDADYAAAHAGKCAILVFAYSENFDTGNIDAAQRSCANALDLNPNLDVVHTALGELYQATGRYADAESAYLRALSIAPKSVAALTGLGTNYMITSRAEDAESRFREAIGLHPGDWSAYNALGRFLYRSGRFAEAANEYARVVALDSQNLIGYSNIGTANLMLGNFDIAAAALQKSIDIDPRANTYANLGLVFYYLGDLAKSIESLQTATGLSPGDRLAWSNLGDAMWNSGRTDEATAVFETAKSLATEALTVNSSDASTLMDLAWINAMLNDNGEARRLIDESIRQSPDDPYGHFYNGLIWLRSDNSSAALDALEKAIETGYSQKLMAAEPHLSPLRGNRRFANLVSADK